MLASLDLNSPTPGRAPLMPWQRLRCARTRDGGQPHQPVRRRLVRCIDFEREFSKLTGDHQTILLLAFREHQPHSVIAQIARCSERAVSYKIPAALAQLAQLLDRASML